MNRRGYNKFLDISKDITVSINEEKIREDMLWDGLKGYLTNTDLPVEEVISQYHGLWVVETCIPYRQWEPRLPFHREAYRGVHLYLFRSIQSQ